MLRPILLLVAMAGSAGAGAPPSSERPQVVAVESGHARLALGPARGRWLVVVSCLAADAGPHEFQLSCQAVPASNDIATPQPFDPEGILAHPIPEPASPESAPPAAAAAPAPERTFFLMVREGDAASPSNYLPIQARLAGTPGRHVAVYADVRDADTLRPGLVEEITSSLETAILPEFARRWGVAHDVDGDGRLAVLLSGWLARLGGGRLAADGFVRGADFDPNLAPPYSNHCDLIYLNPRIPGGGHLRTVLAHEYAHAVAISRKNPGGLGAQGPVREEEGWLDEAVAHLVEDEFAFSRSNLEGRVQAFRADPARYRLVVRDYYAANLFRSHGSRGSTYLFLRWCADRAGATELIGSLMASDRAGIANLESATGTPFADLYRAWSLDLALRSFLGTTDGPVPGPRFETVRPGSSPSPLVRHCAGTSSAYFVVEGSAGSMLDVAVSHPDEVWQVTAVRLPEDLPALGLTARIVRPATDDAAARVRLLIRNQGSEPMELESLTWHVLDPPADGRRPDEESAGRLTTAELAARFGPIRLSPGASAASQPIDAPDTGGSALAVELTAHDDRGHRTAGWAVVGDSDAGDSAGPEPRR
jgi:hypothetical protein